MAIIAGKANDTRTTMYNIILQSVDLYHLNTLLLCGEVVGAIVAGFGIYWETKEGGKEYKRIASACILFGITVEPLFTTALFFSEEYDSRMQGETIKSQNSTIGVQQSTMIEAK